MWIDRIGCRNWTNGSNLTFKPWMKSWDSDLSNDDRNIEFGCVVEIRESNWAYISVVNKIQWKE